MHNKKYNIQENGKVVKEWGKYAYISCANCSKDCLILKDRLTVMTQKHEKYVERYVCSHCKKILR